MMRLLSAHARARSRRDDRGAVAVMVAVLAMVLLGVGALAVDFGQVYAKRGALQSSADLAALAGAAELEQPSGCTDEVVTAAERKLNDPSNEVALQTPADLRDGSADNGAISCREWRVRVTAPMVRVEYGLAQAVTSESGFSFAVSAEASVLSPQAAIFPGYVTAGCDYGPQTVFAPSAGDEGYVPTLEESTAPYAEQNLLSLEPDAISPNQSTSLTIRGGPGASLFADTTFVAFTAEDGQHLEYPVGGSSPTITVDDAAGTVTLSSVPSAVRSDENVWWVRLSKDLLAPSSWSPPDEALALTVGDPHLECQGAGNDLRFGEAAIPNPLSSNVRVGTNVSSSAGYPGTELTTYLLTGGGPRADGFYGGLAGVATSEDCRPGGGTGRIEVDGTTYDVNDDYLTCFFNDGATDVSAVSGPSPPEQVVGSKVLDSRRFFWMPVLSSPPPLTGANRTIVDFRPTVITGELAGSRRNSTAFSPDTDNGLLAAAGDNSLGTIQMVLFDAAALPETVANRPSMPYLGVGPKIVVLTD